MPDSGLSVIQVQSPGLLTTVQDPGREGFGPLGVSASGAADPFKSSYNTPGWQRAQRRGAGFDEAGEDFDADAPPVDLRGRAAASPSGRRGRETGRPHAAGGRRAFPLTIEGLVESGQWRTLRPAEDVVSLVLTELKEFAQHAVAAHVAEGGVGSADLRGAARSGPNFLRPYA